MRLVAGPNEEPFDETANDALRTWLENVDLLRAIDRDEGRRKDAAASAASPDQTLYLGPEGWLMDVPFAPDTRSSDDVEAAVIDYAVEAAVFDHMSAEGYELGTYGFFGSIKCEVSR